MNITSKSVILLIIFCIVSCTTAFASSPETTLVGTWTMLRKGSSSPNNVSLVFLKDGSMVEKFRGKPTDRNGKWLLASQQKLIHVDFIEKRYDQKPDIVTGIIRFLDKDKIEMQTSNKTDNDNVRPTAFTNSYILIRATPSKTSKTLPISVTPPEVITDKVALSELKNLRTGCEAFYADHDRYPASFEELKTKSWMSDACGNELRCEYSVSKDRKNNNLFVYHVKGKTVYSYSSDSAEIIETSHNQNQHDASKNTYTDPVTGMEFILVGGGCYQMGSYSGDANEKPVSSVCVDSFFIGKYEVTQEQWGAVIDGRYHGVSSTPSDFKGNSRPVESVSWDDVHKFIDHLNKGASKNYRLPTEAEWEFAARGGMKSQGFKYAGSNSVDKVAWNSSNSGAKTADVGRLKPNGLGLYDMSGNVHELCEDNYWPYYKVTQMKNPSGPPLGPPPGERYGYGPVIRGGSWDDLPEEMRVSNRSYSGYGYTEFNSVGFRLVFPVAP